MALGRADQVVLMRPCADVPGSLTALRGRCAADEGHDWVVDGVDRLQRWLTDGCDEHLATHVVVTVGQAPEETAVETDLLD